VISNLLAGEPHPRSLTVTIQKELADRIIATPRNKDYGALSVWIQSQADVHVVRMLAPSVFWPRPKIESAVIRIDVDDQRRSAIDDLQFFRQFTRALFLHRRKFLRANMVAALKRHLSKEQVDTILDHLQLTGDVRTEQLDVATIQRLCARVHQDAPQWQL